MASQHLTETEATHFFVQPKEGEKLRTLLKRCIPQVQTKRARAYHRLEQALRKSESVAMPQSRSKTNPSPREQIPLTEPLDDDYATVCANVTEDLKLCSEAILELGSVLANHGQVEGPLRESEPKEIGMVIGWLDQLQELEERKLVATVSRHVLSRSKQTRTLSGEEMTEKVGKYVREVNYVHEMINEILQEMREYFLEYDIETANY